MLFPSIQNLDYKHYIKISPHHIEVSISDNSDNETWFITTYRYTGIDLPKPSTMAVHSAEFVTRLIWVKYPDSYVHEYDTGGENYNHSRSVHNGVENKNILRIYNDDNFDANEIDLRQLDEEDIMKITLKYGAHLNKFDAETMHQFALDVLRVHVSSLIIDV